MTKKKTQEEKQEDEDYRTNFSGMFALGSMVKEDYEILKRNAKIRPLKSLKKRSTKKKAKK